MDPFADRILFFGNFRKFRTGGTSPPQRPTPTPPLVCMTRGEGAGTTKKFSGWQGGLDYSGAEGGTPTLFVQDTTPLHFQRKGSPYPPSRRTLHAKHTFWDWKREGVVPAFLPDRGGEGRFMQMEN